jgi:1,4-dihydroxy-2-naphthoate polyprenyltransferase
MKKWLKAARLRTLPLASSSVLVAGAVSNALHGNMNVLVFILALLTAIALQILSNFANDLGDFQKGTDNANRIGPMRSVQSGEISEKEMRTAVVLAAMFSFVLGLLLLWISLGHVGLFSEALILLGIGVAAIGAAIKYTMGKGAYGYRGLGDVSVFLFFGLIAVLGTYFLLNPEWQNIWEALPSAIMVGAFSTAVLNLNNLRDIVNDRAAGKKTMVVFLGFDKAKLYHLFLISSAIATMVYSIILIPSLVSLFGTLAIIPLFIHLKKVMANTEPSLLDVELKKIALTCFAVSLVLFISSLI